MVLNATVMVQQPEKEEPSTPEFTPEPKVDKTIKLWNLATKEEIAAIATPSWQVGAIAFSPDGKTLASSDEQSAIRLWQI